MSTPTKPSPGPWRWGWYDDTSLIDEDALCNDNGGKLGVYADDFALEAADKALIARAPEMAAMLRDLEWAGGESVARCPECGARPERLKDVYFERPVADKPGFVVREGAPVRTVVPGGHTPDCRLAALLKSLPG